MLKKLFGLLAPAASLFVPSVALAEEAVNVSQGEFVANNAWMMVCIGLVFIMHLGFAMLETGLTRAKNTVNILFKNTFTVCIGLLTYYVIGFGLMYPGTFNGFAGFAGWGLNATPEGMTAAYADGGYTYYTDFLFQGMFAATCATIVSGAVAERIQLRSFMLFVTLFVALAYPLAGAWHWGGGFIKQAGFYDFAGSTLVHSVGGWAALVGILFLGPRRGKYGKDGSVAPIPGSNMPLATVGAFLLWLGWFGFNGGSVLSANPEATSLVLVTTCLAAAAGGVGAMFAYNFVSRKPDLSMALNGILAGLVGVTAGADVVTPVEAILIGGVAGALVVGAVIFFDKVRIDDPVGAASVHLVCGVWGTLAVGIFGEGKSLVAQLYGIGVYAVFAVIVSAILFGLIKITLGLRVSEEEELEGLDAGEHNMHAYDMGTGISARRHVPVNEPEAVPAE
ncbi:MAG: ammonium transporter [Polyangiaceae bacterium]|nr:ammonium transporter [Polyangiaceae bacterium]MCW5789802.1 ammonium transporter [Polyangiaceae bacterium]